jgi:hypothetical protein
MNNTTISKPEHAHFTRAEEPECFNGVVLKIPVHLHMGGGIAQREP